MKKILLVSISCLMLVCILCSCDIASMLAGSKFTFAENGEEYTFTGKGDSTDAEIVIPETYKKKPVTAIGDRALYFNLMASVMSSEETVYITSVTLPETITKIGKEAFANNSKLTSVNIPASVKSIGEMAFYECSSLTSITLPDGITEIKPYTFAGCSNLKSITIPDSVTVIGEGAFSGCSSLETIDIPDGVTIISPLCFKGCGSLKDFTISENIEGIGDYAFSGCSSLGKMTIPSTVLGLGEYIFYEVGEGVEISVCYDTEAPADWNEKWCGNMQGGKAMNTSEAYYNNVVLPNVEKAEELKAKIANCNEQYSELNDEIGRWNEASKPAQASGNPDAYRYYRDKINECKDQQRYVLEQKRAYEEELAALKLTPQLNG